MRGAEMDTGELKALLETAKCGSINKVADKLGYTQSGLTYVLNSLEKELGIKLLHRGHSGVTLTPEGEELLPMIEGIVANTEGMEQRTKRMRALNSGIIHIGAYNSVVMIFLHETMCTYKEKHPDTQFELTTGVTTLSYLMDSKNIDIAICEEHVVSGGYLWEPLLDDEMCIVVRKDDPLAGKTSIPLTALTKCHIVYPNVNINGIVMRRIEEEGIHFEDQTNIVTTDGSTTLQIIGRNGGVSFVSKMYESECPDNVVFISAEPKMIRTLGIATPANQPASKSVNGFISHLKKSIKSIK